MILLLAICSILFIAACLRAKTLPIEEYIDKIYKGDTEDPCED